MANLNVNRVTNANIFADGASWLGMAEEVNLPDLKTTMSDFKALGMKGMLELPAGFDKMECSIKWNAIYPKAKLKFANPYQTVKIQIRSNLEVYQGSQKVADQPIVIFMNVQSKNTPGGGFKQNDNVELTTNLNVLSYKEVINGEEIVEFDALNNIFKVGGVDQLTKYRENLGIS